MAKSKSGKADHKLKATYVAVWNLEIAGYGEFLYVGTELEAQVRAELKTEQEGARRAPKVTRVRALTVNEARIYAEYGPDTTDGYPYYGKG
jgi:hypothetical protein